MKKTIHYLAAISCFALSASLGAAQAHAEPMGHDEHMSGDHRAGGQMHEQMEDKHFKEMDTNGDGMVSKAEFDAADE